MFHKSATQLQQIDKSFCIKTCVKGEHNTLRITNMWRVVSVYLAQKSIQTEHFKWFCYMPKAVAKSCVNVVAIYLYWHNKLTKHIEQKVEIESADPKHLVHPKTYQWRVIDLHLASFVIFFFVCCVTTWKAHNNFFIL